MQIHARKHVCTDAFAKEHVRTIRYMHAHIYTCIRTRTLTHITARTHARTQSQRKNVRICMHTRACTHTHLRMHKPQHANAHSHALHAYNGDTHIHARTTHMQTQAVGVGVEKGSRACGMFEKLNDNVCLNGFWALQANSNTKHCGDQWGTRSELFNSCKMNSLEIIRIACGINLYMHGLFQRGATDPPKGGVFQMFSCVPVFATVKCGSKWYYPQQLSLTVANGGAHAELPAA